MYINLRKDSREIKYGDIIEYQDEACVVIQANELNSDFPVLIVNLSRSKVVNTVSNLDVLRDAEFKVLADEEDVQITFLENTKGY